MNLDSRIDEAKKRVQYSIILKHVKAHLDNPTHACTLPGLSGFAFEDLLTKEYPGIKIDCFENSWDQMYKLKDLPKPSNVAMVFGNVEDNMPIWYEYDIIWLDYCGICRLNQWALSNYVAPKSVFAVTEYKDRGMKERHIQLSSEAEKVEDYTYRHMRFRVFKLGEEFYRKYRITPYTNDGGSNGCK